MTSPPCICAATVDSRARAQLLAVGARCAAINYVHLSVNQAPQAVRGLKVVAMDVSAITAEYNDELKRQIEEIAGRMESAKALGITAVSIEGGAPSAVAFQFLVTGLRDISQLAKDLDLDVWLHNRCGTRLEQPLDLHRVFVEVHAENLKIDLDVAEFHRSSVNPCEPVWAFEGLGVISFTNELWTDLRMYMKEDRPSTEERRKFRDLLQFEDVYVPYHEYEHPTYGPILIGGTKKFSNRVTPPWMLEEGCHRNFAFTMFHADEMPQVEWGVLKIEAVSKRLWAVTVEVKNDKIIPTILAHARSKKIGARDVITCTAGPGAKVAAAGTVRDLLPTRKLDAVERHPQRIWNDRGIGSRGRRLFRFLIEGEGSVEFEYRSQKGGTIQRTVELTETAIERD